jgi:hypothetical protein
MSKNGMSKDSKRQLRDEIQSLLGSLNNEDQGSLVIDNELAEAAAPESPYDFEMMSQQFTKKAREITNSLFKNFVDLGVFEENDYAKHKKELDTINISNLFFQLKTLKITIIKVMEQITSGNTHPRLIEVMGQLQDKMAAITKTQANYILFLEETYRQLNNDKPVNGDDQEVNSDSQEGQFFITVGTKNMSKNLPKGEEGSRSNRVAGDLINPTKKSDLMRKHSIEIKEDGLDDFIDLTEII